MSVLKNKVILAVAGAGKTTQLSIDALEKSKTTAKRILLLTYTNNGIGCLIEKIKQNNFGVLQHNIDIMSWYKFILNECVIPYQKDFRKDIDIKGVLFTEDVPKDRNGAPIYRFKKKIDKSRYISSTNKIYSDNMADFLLQISDKENPLYIKRLESIYSDIYIDEVQDLNGEDLEILLQLLKSSINIYLIGDHRQATFNTHNSTKFKKYTGSNIKLIFEEWQKQGLLNIEEKLECHRSIQDICDFADMLYPNESKAQSRHECASDFKGVFLILTKDVLKFTQIYQPFILRWNSGVRTQSLYATNFGESKALTKNSTLIFPTKPLINFYLENQTITSDVSKYYVALTRARDCICIVIDKFPEKDFLDDFVFEDIKLKKFNIEKMKTQY